MAEVLGASASGIEKAIKDVDAKKEELAVQADKVAAAFTELTTTVQLKWLNELISSEWNGRGNQTVENAKSTMEDLMSKLNEIKETAEQVSNG